MSQRRHRSAPIARRFSVARRRTRQGALRLDRPLKSWPTRSPTDSLYSLSGRFTRLRRLHTRRSARHYVRLLLPLCRRRWQSPWVGTRYDLRPPQRTCLRTQPSAKRPQFKGLRDEGRRGRHQRWVRLPLQLRRFAIASGRRAFSWNKVLRRRDRGRERYSPAGLFGLLLPDR